MATMTAPKLNERLEQARKEAKGLREQLAFAESDLAKALEDRDYAAAEDHKKAADELRQPVLIAEAHVKALIAGAQELEAHRAAEQRATQEREQREQAGRQFEEATAREAQAMDEMNQHLAQLREAYVALRQIVSEAIAAQQRAGQARLDSHHAGIGAGIWAQDMPQPALPNHASVLIDYSPVLLQIMQNPQLPS
ncbi:hypothetical protein [Actinacidiphila oryziradicis]|uniref:Uncharacterized protein n=1 Tax=Actinacidiphila oryziradicis TaxID=2571141 RepID=A0A4U0SUK5_9ACTN|nr:hypothetical protein [Actinacidiphila oryziradicis]TKA11747.1 hypothetical protein FCI23_10480 [Actinacidiphila oryziradicis]